MISSPVLHRGLPAMPPRMGYSSRKQTNIIVCKFDPFGFEVNHYWKYGDALCSIFRFKIVLVRFSKYTILYVVKLN
uniref:Uncharacterized protein n=1 Tax=Setaria viridis TaxID=4556 RepID=A0A4U6WHI5_SETVI|nr:hypothetical protein SEVIR_1G265550v2 [Setaria viridis]TKW40739.1 hypothetical protein SEVIR_1G265550v2 [Setaria viridis]TKW40740.1 hypothetical protein SEVIR_1G265550v2 [Setaria viridis]TKW40741.1 hypothetical protein SEVIR_1G265550v2 [Setaria viridis]